MASLTTKAVEKIVRSGLPGMTNDGDGLYLKVGRTGGASWIFRYKLAGKSRDMGLGKHPEVCLAIAREKAAEARKLSKSGVDPLTNRDDEIERQRLKKEAERLAQDAARAKAITFKEVALDYISAHRSGWRNAKHAQQWENTLTTYAFKVIGDLPTQEIGIEHVLKILKPIWTVIPETASRLRNRIELVLDAAKARGLRDRENPARWRGHLDKLLPPRSKVRTVKHHAAMSWTELPAFMATLDKADDLSSKALCFTILTACRTSEALEATWTEIDLATGIWTISASRMKAGKEHRVPLSQAALDLLATLPRVEGSNYLFPGARKKRPLSNMAMLMVLRRMRRSDLTTHGFRSTFRDWASEVTHYPREVCEQALAHTLESAVEAAYRRGDLFEKRRRLMDDWAGYAMGMGNSAKATSRPSVEVSISSQYLPFLLATAATPATTRVIPGLQHGDRSGDCRRCKPLSWGFLDQAHASGKAPHSHSQGLTLKTDERPPGHGKPPASKVFQRYRLAQDSPPKSG